MYIYTIYPLSLAYTTHINLPLLFPYSLQYSKKVYCRDLKTGQKLFEPQIPRFQEYSSDNTLINNSNQSPDINAHQQQQQQRKNSGKRSPKALYQAMLEKEEKMKQKIELKKLFFEVYLFVKS